MFRPLRSLFTKRVKAPVFPLKNVRFITEVKPLVTVVPVQRRRWPLRLAIIGLVTGAIYYRYRTRHSFPPTVAELLKEGVYATINGAGHNKPDLKLALAKYISALQEADRLKMVPWTDEYTGIQSLIADIYTRLGLEEEAVGMYVEISSSLINALVTGRIPPLEMEKAIQRDLRVVLLASILMSGNQKSLSSVIEYATPHLAVATKAAVGQSEELKHLLFDFPEFNAGYLKDISEKRLPTDMFGSCFLSFKDEWFALRELITGVFVVHGEYLKALSVKLKTTQIMLTSGFTTGECLLSAANIAALMYLQAQKGQFLPDEEPSFIQIKGEEHKIALDLLSEPTNSDSELPKQSFFALSEKLYGDIVDTINSLDQKRSDFIPEAYAMAIYGKGVIAACQGQWDVADDTIEQARLRSRGCQIEPLIEACASELDKIKEFRNLSPAELAEIDSSEFPSFDVMFWQTSPDLDDIELAF